MAKMGNPPLYYVVAQVRFNAVLTLDQYVPSIQDSFRKAGFPDFQKRFIAALNFNFAGSLSPDQPVSAVAAPLAQYAFTDESGRAGFVLEHAALAYQTTCYDTFEPFLQEMMRGLEVVHKNAELSFVERIGIRFLDAVLPGPGEKLEQYLSERVLGLVGKFENRQLVQSICETRTLSDKADLTSRAVIWNQAETGSVAQPPDLGISFVKIQDKFSEVRGVYGIIDTDSSYSKREKFDLREIEKVFVSLHSALRMSFDLMVTPYARKMWE